MATKNSTDDLNIPYVGLLVDKANPVEEAFYVPVGFRYSNDDHWEGHEMKHLILWGKSR